MSHSNSVSMLQPCRNTADGNARHVGVEIELAGIGGEELAECVAENFKWR